LDAVESKNLEQDGRLDSAEDRLDDVESKNLEQDGRLDAVESKNLEQDGRLTNIENTRITRFDIKVRQNLIGDIDGTNAEFRLDYPIHFDSEQLYLNGLLQEPNHYDQGMLSESNDYSIEHVAVEITYVYDGGEDFTITSADPSVVFDYTAYTDENNQVIELVISTQITDANGTSTYEVATVSQPFSIIGDGGVISSVPVYTKVLFNNAPISGDRIKISYVRN
jgi:hypothetical protein